MLRLIRISFFLDLKEKRNIAFMLLLPLLMTLILGIAVGPIFEGDSDGAMESSVWFYNIEDSRNGERFREFLDMYHHQLAMEMTEETDKYAALNAVSNMRVDAYLIYADDVITIYRNEHAPQVIQWLEIVFNNYLMRASIIEDIMADATDVMLMQFIQSNAMEVGSHVALLQIETIRQPDAIGYYAVAMLTLTSCYSMIVLILTLSEEKRRNTIKRYLLSGKSLFSFLFSKSISVCAVLSIKFAFIMLFNTFVYRVEFGDIRSWLTVLVATIIFTFAVTQFAVLMALIFKNLTALVVVLNAAFLPVVLFFGGAYLYFQRLVAIGLGDFIVFSPVYHINRGLFDVIYLNSYDHILRFLTILMPISLFMVLSNILLAKWRKNTWAQ